MVAINQTIPADSKLIEMILRLEIFFLSFTGTKPMIVSSVLIKTSTLIIKISANCFNVTISGIDSPRSHFDNVLSE